MHHVRTIVPNDVYRFRGIDEHFSFADHSLNCLDAVSGAKNTPENPIDAIPVVGRLIRGLIVDAILNDDGTIREFRIGRTK